MLRLTKTFTRMIGALRPEGARLPVEGPDALQFGVGLDQAGWGDPDTLVVPFSWSIPGATAPATYDLVTGLVDGAPASFGHQWSVLSLSISTTGSVGGDVLLQYVSATGFEVPVSRSTVPTTLEEWSSQWAGLVSAALDSDDLLPTGPLFVPPGFKPQLRVLFTQDNPPAQTLVTGCAVRIPAGYAAGAP